MKVELQNPSCLHLALREPERHLHVWTRDKRKQLLQSLLESSLYLDFSLRYKFCPASLKCFGPGTSEGLSKCYSFILKQLNAVHIGYHRLKVEAHNIVSTMGLNAKRCANLSPPELMKNTLAFIFSTRKIVGGFWSSLSLILENGLASSPDCFLTMALEKKSL